MNVLVTALVGAGGNRATAGVMQGYLEDVLFAHDMTTDDLGSLVNLSLSDMITKAYVQTHGAEVHLTGGQQAGVLGGAGTALNGEC